jgi:flagellar biosynthesis GTPase FlhF
MPATKATGVDKEVDELFQLPLGEFTAARNALVAKLKKDGQAEEADRVKAIAKPPVSAWTVNQLYWRHRPEFNALLASGERLRKAQASHIAGKSADMPGALEAHREALTALSKRAVEVLKEAGHPASPEMMRRITTTLEAVGAYGTLPEAPQAGRLSDDMDPPGFEVLAGLAPAAGGRATAAPTRVLPFRQKSARQARTKKDEEAERQARLAEARTAVAEAEKTLREARREAEQAEAALKRAAARAKKAQQDKEREEKRFEKMTAAADVATKDAHQVARKAEEAAQTVTDAERQLERARAQLEALE